MIFGRSTKVQRAFSILLARCHTRVFGSEKRLRGSLDSCICAVGYHNHLAQGCYLSLHTVAAACTNATFKVIGNFHFVTAICTTLLLELRRSKFNPSCKSPAVSLLSYPMFVRLPLYNFVPFIHILFIYWSLPLLFNKILIIMFV